MVRVAGLKQQLTGEIEDPAPDGLTPNEQLGRISALTHELVDRQMAHLCGALLPELARDGTFVLVRPEHLAPDELAALDDRFLNDVFPVLTPIAVDPGHPFPHVRNKSLNVGVMFTREPSGEAGFGVVQVPMMLPRLLQVAGVRSRRRGRAARVRPARGPRRAARRHHLPRVRLRGVYAFRVTRNFDIGSTKKKPRTSSRRSSRSSAGANAARPSGSRCPASPPLRRSRSSSRR